MNCSCNPFQAALSFLNFLPLWVVVLFIDIRSIMKGGSVGTEYLSVGAIILGMVLSLIVVVVGLRRKKDLVTDEYQLENFEESRTVSAEMLLTYVLPLFAFDFTLWDETLQFLVFFSVVFWLSCRHRAAFEGVFLEIINYRCYRCKLKKMKNGQVVGDCIDKNVLIKDPLNGCGVTKLKQIKDLNRDVMICQKCSA